MKRFTIISLLVLMTAPALACTWSETHNYYLFSVCDRTDIHETFDRISRDNWKAYLGLSGDDEYWFDADEIIKAARQKGDQLMVSYVQNLKDYLECVRLKEREQYEWDYPTAEERAQGTRTLQRLRTYAQSKLGTRLRSQHALLLMRCNMLMGRHGENVTFWEQTACNYIESVYKDMMQNIYAGALLKTGKGDKAGQLFAQQGDWKSLMTQYYRRRSYQAIRQEYQRDAQSAVLPFLLQDFVNNAQEATDADNPLAGDVDGKLFIRNIQRQEAMQMIQLCAQAVREGRTAEPALWMSAKAWLEYMYGNHSQALADINTAKTMQGRERTKDNVRVLQLYITAMQATPNPQFDTYLAGELQWLDSKKEDDDHYGNVADRVVHQALTKRYEQAGRGAEALALLQAAHSSMYGDYIDTMQVDHLLQFISYMETPAETPLDRYLKPRQQLMEKDQQNDLIGTKYMRQCQWEEAQQWLKKVPLSYYNQKGYAVYAANRTYTVEPWMKRQWLNSDAEWNHPDISLTDNPKLTFCREMQQMEKDLGRLSGKKLQQRCYDLAVRYAQADQTGDCWFLMHDGKSAYLQLSPHDTNLKAKAVDMLRVAALATDFKLKERALFALSYIYLNDDQWFNYEWNGSVNDYIRVVQSATQHYKAWAALVAHERTAPANTSDYVTRCDEYKQFLKVFGR